MHACYSYLSSKASCNPVKTLFVLAPQEQARTVESAERFARESGWVEQAELDAAVLLVPVAPDGWDACSVDLLMEIYRERCKSFIAASGESIPGAYGVVWMWETLIYVAGYAEGATFAGNCMLAHPGFAAASVLVDGSPSAYEVLSRPSSHWLVSEPHDYHALNRDVPVACWLMGSAACDGRALGELRNMSHATEQREMSCGGYEGTCFFDPIHPAHQIRVTPGLTGTDPLVAQSAMEQFFSMLIRWKNAPDGILEEHISRREFFEGDEYAHHEVRYGGESHHYALYLPAGMSREQARNMPLVLSVHGRGEPSWIFCQKNGWERLADETRSFVVMLPDSKGNIWSYERDADAFEVMVADAVGRYGLDASRVYLTGFSNGALFTTQMATARPGLFASASPWNSPGAVALASLGADTFVYAPDFAQSGFQMPMWTCYGDSDNKAPASNDEGFDIVLAANGGCAGCEEVWEGTEHYAPRDGFANGSRLSTRVFRDAAGTVVAGFTIVDNMPHGAIADEARAAWEFMRRFRRPEGSPRVEVIS